MGSTSTAEERELTPVGGRYAIVGALGEGGVAVVHRARDTVTGRDVALKRLRATTSPDRDRGVELFQREFHTLSQLAHPNVVSVYDYGVHDDAPYYTMELLDGGDLLDGVPYPWRTACSLARDVCSALSLIHSRRMVYRDLSPKNVRCTSDGRAKLLDFGALSPMGRAKIFVGTPAISAPEAVHLQQLDARTDLYSLGATLYYALSGRRPYPASRLSELYELWKTPPPPPGRFAPDVPPALDELVMELLQVDPALRPISAAETLDRLSGIAGFEREESAHLASNAYLSTPTLIGRDTSLERFRRVLKSALTDTGGAVLVHGPRGVGRTRFLDACVLEAKLGGALVLRADASDAHAGDYAVARTLATQLLDAAPDVARAHAEPKLDILRRVVPSLASPESTTSPLPAASIASDVQRALREWFIGVAADRPLCVAVDDVHRIDLPSAGLVALLAREAAEHRLLVVTTIPSGEAYDRSTALSLLAQESRPISLARLSAARSEHLLRSLFGDVPNVELVANRLQALSGGLPRDLMQLSQHLVDRGLARYRSGTWTLPREVAKDLPSDMTQARREKIDSLGADARALARVIALDKIGKFSLGECVVLSGNADSAKVMQSLDELVSAELVTVSDNEYCLSAMGFREALVQSMEAGEKRASYERLAKVCARRPGAGLSEAAYLFEAGDEERGLDALVKYADGSMRATGASIELFTQLVQSLPNDWLSTFDRGLSLCEKYGRPPAEAYTLRARVAGICSQLIIDAAPYYAPLFEESRKEVDAALRAFQESRARQDEAGAAADPSNGAGDALKAAVLRLGQTIGAAIGCAAASLSLELLRAVPNLTPFATLAPAFASWQTLAEGVNARLREQTDVARAIYVGQLELLDATGGGLEETYRITQILGISQTLGMIEASMGLPQCLERAKLLDASPLYQSNAVRIRMLYALWQGDVTEAGKYKKQVELLTIERARRQSNEGGHLLRELLGHAVMDDLTRVKQTLDAIEPLSHRASGWKTVMLWAESEYQRIRGNASAALEKAEAALASMHPAGHPVWAEAASSRVRLLVMLDRSKDAADAGLEYLAEAERRDIGYERHYIRMPLAVALARLGRTDEAKAQADTAIERLAELGTTGLNLGLAYETRARVAMALGDKADFERYLKLCAAHYRVNAGGPLATRYERLVREERAQHAPNERLQTKPSEHTTLAMSTTRMRARLDTTDPERRARAALELLLEESGADEGVLFRLEDGRLELRARVGAGEVSAGLLLLAEQYMAEQQRADEVTLVTVGDSETRSEWAVDGDHVYRPVVLCHESDDSIVMTGLALLRSSAGARFRHPASTASHLSRIVWQTEQFQLTQG
ncbi:MAG TPA: protein kinase [Polyangiaceae bacterium]|nr:protein kinase [Polyangiaceae bacterium]